MASTQSSLDLMIADAVKVQSSKEQRVAINHAFELFTQANPNSLKGKSSEDKQLFLFAVLPFPADVIRRSALDLSVNQNWFAPADLKRACMNTVCRLHAIPNVKSAYFEATRKNLRVPTQWSHPVVFYTAKTLGAAWLRRALEYSADKEHHRDQFTEVFNTMLKRHLETGPLEFPRDDRSIAAETKGAILPPAEQKSRLAQLKKDLFPDE